MEVVPFVVVAIDDAPLIDHRGGVVAVARAVTFRARALTAVLRAFKDQPPHSLALVVRGSPLLVLVLANEAARERAYLQLVAVLRRSPAAARAVSQAPSSSSSSSQASMKMSTEHAVAIRQSLASMQRSLTSLAQRHGQRCLGEHEM